MKKKSARLPTDKQVNDLRRAAGVAAGTIGAATAPATGPGALVITGLSYVMGSHAVTALCYGMKVRCSECNATYQYGRVSNCPRCRSKKISVAIPR